MLSRISAAIAVALAFAPAAFADCAASYQKNLVGKLYDIQAPGAVINAGELTRFVEAEAAKCPNDYQGNAFAVYLVGVAAGREPDPAKRAEQINLAFQLMRNASDHYDSNMKPFTYVNQNGMEQTMWAWSHAKTTLAQTLIPYMIDLAEKGVVEPSLKGGAPAVCPYGKETRLADETEGQTWMKILQNSSILGTAGMGNEDERKAYDRKLAIYDQRVDFAQNRLASLAKSCPDNTAQFLYDRARVLGSWASYSGRQLNKIDRAFEDHRIHSSDSKRMYQLQDDLETQRNERARTAKAAYDAFYASKAETGSHLEFRLGDEQTYIDVTGWAKNKY